MKNLNTMSFLIYLAIIYFILSPKGRDKLCKPDPKHTKKIQQNEESKKVVNYYKTYKLYKYGKRLSINEIRLLLYKIGFIGQQNFVSYESKKHGAVLDTYSVEELPDSIEAKEIRLENSNVNS